MAKPTIGEIIKNQWDKVSARLLYTPSEQEVQAAVKVFLEKEPGWIDRAVSLDPALSDKNEEEIAKEVLTYQGLHAIALHQKAHTLYNDGEFSEARRLSQGTRRVTGGIEIHPGAKIDKGFFIDHGAGIVIGETAEIGNNVFLYHGVTLGANGQKREAGERRHPKLGDNVQIGNNVQILGAATIGNGVTVNAGARIIGDVTIGDGAVIAAGVEVRKDVEAGHKVYGIVPNIPQIINDKERYEPISVPMKQEGVPSAKVEKMAWYGTLSNALAQMVGAAKMEMRVER